MKLKEDEDELKRKWNRIGNEGESSEGSQNPPGQEREGKIMRKVSFRRQNSLLNCRFGRDIDAWESWGNGIHGLNFFLDILQPNMYLYPHNLSENAMNFPFSRPLKNPCIKSGQYVKKQTDFRSKVLLVL
jgi:hypothetical protein